jgi:palmitoyl transferase
MNGDQLRKLRHAMMWRLARPFLSLIFLLAFSGTALAETGDSWFDAAEQKLVKIWNEGDNELYLPLRTYHLRSAYGHDTIKTLNEQPWGIGFGRGIYDADGDWHGLYFTGFQDSNFKPQYMLGYAYQTWWRLADELKLGLGCTIFLTARSDTAHYTPFPGIVPTASLEYQRVSFNATFVPGTRMSDNSNFGNLFFFWAKVRLDR